jgi:hypothetical protein
VAEEALPPKPSRQDGEGGGNCDSRICRRQWGRCCCSWPCRSCLFSCRPMPRRC